MGVIRSVTADVWDVPLSDVVHAPNAVLARSAARIADDAENQDEVSSGFSSAIGPEDPVTR